MLLAGALMAGLLVAMMGRQGEATTARADEARVPQRRAEQPKAQAPAGHERKARLVLTARWGSGAGELGHEAPAEGAPVGPMSFAVDDRGHVHVLDTVNQRIVVFDGDKRTRQIKLPSAAVDDLALTTDGYLVVDRHVDKQVHAVGRDGRVTKSVALAGKNVPSTGLVSALFSRDDGVWVELEHSRLVRVAGPSLEADEARPMVPGRFTRDGKALLSARRLLPDGLRVSQRAPGLQERVIAEPRFSAGVSVLTALEQGASGVVLVGVELRQDEEVAPYRAAHLEHLLLGFGADGAELFRAKVPMSEVPEEVLRPVRLGDDGVLYAMVFRREGVEIYGVQP